MRLFSFILLLSFASISNSYASGETLVLVHGFDSNSSVWHRQGVTQQLLRSGWQDAGNLSLQRPGGDYFNKPRELKPYHFITVELPSEAPITLQAELLDSYLRYIQTNSPEQKMTLIGHSAGGVVSRLVAIKNRNLPIKRLITIASPHLGSGIAEVGELAAKSPISFITPLIGADVINRSEELFEQLSREKPGTFLFWLNRQTHPDIEYISIIRTDGSWFDKDFFVHAYSQNINHVHAISNAQVILSPGKHELNYRDGFLLVNILDAKAHALKAF